MRATRPSMQELIGRRKRAGFVGRRSELELFRGNFDTAPEDERHTFVFHVHGTAGVGKSSLVRELEAVAAQRKALTACTDETVNSVPEAMAAISARFARQGAELKALDKLLAAYRQRRHEADTASAALETGPDAGAPLPPSAGGMAVSQAGLIGLGMVPFVGAFAGAVDPAQVAQGTDRLRAALSARFRNHDDVQLVLEPLKVLTPVFVAELDRVAADVPWITLFFDTYERTAPFLDAWLLDLVTTDRHGALPANVILTLAGQHGPDPVRWGDYAGIVTELALEPFTESEARQLLAAKRVVDEDVVREVLRLSGGLPVLVSTLAKDAGGAPGTVDDPAATAVERFLKWERDPARRATALACALPRWLDEDVLRAAVDHEETAGLYEWLRGLPFVSEREGPARYHDVVRTAMLRLQRVRGPRQWAERHTRLAEAFGGWRADAEEGLEPDALWLDEPWRELRFEESYHQLCARPQAALGPVLADVVRACLAGQVAVRGYAQVLSDAGEQTDAAVLRTWGRDLLEALSGEPDEPDESEAPLPVLGLLPVLRLLLDRAALDASGQAMAHFLRGQELRRGREYERALAEYDRAVALDPASAGAYHGRGLTHRGLRDDDAALADLRRADELSPGTAHILFDLGEVLRLTGRHQDAVDTFDRVLALDPSDEAALASRAHSRVALGDPDGALADFDRALRIDEEYLWALVHRARLYRDLDRPDEAFTDLDRAVELAPDNAWMASERGDAYRLEGRYAEAVEELGRACALDPDYASAHASRGYALARLHRDEEARAAFDRAIELSPAYVWALVHRGRLRRDTGDGAGALADLDRAVAADPSGALPLVERAAAHTHAGRYEEALADYDLALERDPESAAAAELRTGVLLMLRRHEEAITELDRVLRADPDDALTLEVRGWVQLARRRYLEALRDMDRALALRPDRAGPYGARARTYLAIGRLDRALADLDQCVRRDEDAEWARGRTIDVLLHQGRYDEALERLDEARAAAVAGRDTTTMYRCWYADVMTGRWERARHTAEWLHANDADEGPVAAALTVGLREGSRAAGPLWRAIAANTESAAHQVHQQALADCGSGRWAQADAKFAEALALDPDWEDLADLVNLLSLLSRTPDADPALFAPRIARLTEARDAFRDRYAVETAGAAEAAE